MDTKQTIVNETSAKIAAINDKHRQNMEGCTVTRGIVAMGEDAKEIFVKVRFKKNKSKKELGLRGQ